MTAEPSFDAAGPKLVALRQAMDELELDIYLVPSDDPHLSEYTPDAYKRRAYLTDFYGSAGTAVVTREEALLWTDSRYFNEATLSLDTNHWKLVRQGQPKVPTMTKWLAEQAAKRYESTEKPLRIGIDPFVHAASFSKELKDAFRQENDQATIGELVTCNNANLVDPIWGADRPAIPTSPFRVHPLEYAGTSVSEKVALIRSQMREKKATLAVFSTLDDVAYLLNMRAMGDVETCPVGIAYATVGLEQMTLYCDSKKVTAVQQHLQDANCTVQPYDAIIDDMEDHLQCETSKVWIDKSRANLAIVSVIPDKVCLNAQNAVTPMKACKNAAELQGMRQAHLADGVAMAEFMAWLQHEIVVEGNTVSEVEIDLKLTACRAKQPGFLEVSFPTIAGVGANGAIIHYRAQEGTELLKYLDREQPVLIDSGGQYTYGTTDVTRTWHFSETPSLEFKNYYTRVLKGHIGVDTMVYPENTPGFVLDVFARKSLWDVGADYGHGTGHGVGAALNVHEGPMGIAPRWTNTEVLKKGMVISNEPGYYEDGNFGIRIENLLEISYVKSEHNDDADAPSKGKKFLKFDKLTMIPIQKNLIDQSLMTPEELDWLDAYHQEVLEKVGPLLKEDSPAMVWMQASCEPIGRQ
eukprot:CAMPEP_0119016574 /NCGR_PEP_ID=MMETSP1176-20130426/13638_1 /TAXON_ID=265551 /ORGANISM="Synedropsis recta cf, Strain CCMP1620" /LENGTH=635 /DNA_ID=CAMNT_0006970045 /DNA_START=41 /DNA_END=1948 /DNA_ORIENTATION=-